MTRLHTHQLHDPAQKDGTKAVTGILPALSKEHPGIVLTASYVFSHFIIMLTLVVRNPHYFHYTEEKKINVQKV